MSPGPARQGPLAASHLAGPLGFSCCCLVFDRISHSIYSSVLWQDQVATAQRSANVSMSPAWDYMCVPLHHALLYISKQSPRSPGWPGIRSQPPHALAILRPQPRVPELHGITGEYHEAWPRVIIFMFQRSMCMMSHCTLAPHPSCHKSSPPVLILYSWAPQN